MGKPTPQNKIPPNCYKHENILLLWHPPLGYYYYYSMKVVQRISKWFYFIIHYYSSNSQIHKFTNCVYTPLGRRVSRYLIFLSPSYMKRFNYSLFILQSYIYILLRVDYCFITVRWVYDYSVFIIQFEIWTQYGFMRLCLLYNIPSLNVGLLFIIHSSIYTAMYTSLENGVSHYLVLILTVFERGLL